MTSSVAHDRAKSVRIEISNLRKSYRREGGQVTTPVDNVDLCVDDAEMLVLLGPSGCGKTTLLRCVAGLERPDSGTIAIDGKIVFCSKRNIFVPAEDRQISMIFQSFALWPHMTVAENVAYPLRCRKVPSHEIPGRVETALEMVNVGHLGSQHPGRISGGQQQRVALARALVSQSRVILFDEPLSNVDAQVRVQLRYELKRLQRDIGFSGLYVTHDQLEALELGHRVAVLGEGRVAALAGPREIYEKPGNSYVAGFVGAANIWPGKITATTNSSLRVLVNDFELTAGRPQDGNLVQFSTGEQVLLVARPENISIHADPQGKDNCIRAKLRASMFSGSYIECIADANDLTFRAWLRADEAAGLEFGDDVWLHVPTDKIHVIGP